MKKILTLVLSLALVLTLTGCLKAREELEDIEVVVLAELPDEEILIEFWHVYGQGKSAVLDELIAEFELLYPNITVDSVPQGGYSDILQKTKKAIGTGVTPDLAIGYPDHFAEYIDLGGIIPLDLFVEDGTWGVDLTDFVDSYVAENQQYEDGVMYSMPYSKSTEMLVYNKTIFDANEIYFSNDDILYWSELEVIAETIIGDGPNQCEFLINYDSSANLFINAARQWETGYTNSDGDILVEEPTTIAMLSYFDGLFHDNILTLPLEWEQDYGSTNFLAQDVCMTVGSTAGLSYNIPENWLDEADQFEIGIIPIPQYIDGTPSAMQQGPNIAIMENTSDAERLASWLLIKHLTSAEATAKWAIDTGYLPVRKSGFDSVLYQTLLNDPGLDYIYESMSANAGYAQLAFNDYDPAFAGIGEISSAKVREEAGYALEKIYVETKANGAMRTLQEIEDIIDGMIDQLSW